MKNLPIVLLVASAIAGISWYLASQNQPSNNYLYYKQYYEPAYPLDSVSRKLTQSLTPGEQLHYLNLLIGIQQKTDPSLGTNDLKKVRELAKQFSALELGWAYLNSATNAWANNDIVTGDLYFDSARVLQSQLSEPVAEYFVYKCKSDRLTVLGYYGQRLKNDLIAERLLELRAPWAKDLKAKTSTSIATSLQNAGLHELVEKELRKVNPNDFQSLEQIWLYHRVKFRHYIYQKKIDSAYVYMGQVASRGFDITMLEQLYFSEKGMTEKAIASLRRSLSVSKPGLTELYNRLFTLSDSYRSIQNYDSALYFASLGVRETKRLKKFLHQCEGYNRMATLYLDAGNLNEAELTVDSAFSLAEKNNLYRPLIRSSKIQERVFTAGRKFDKLVKKHRTSSMLTAQYFDSVNSIDLVKSVYLDHAFKTNQEDLITIRDQSAALRITLITVVVLLVSIAVISIYLLRMRKRRLEDARVFNEELRLLNNSLEQRVKDRTQEIELKSEELQRKNDQLEQYAFDNAHRLRSPVATILGLTKLYKMDTASASEKEHYFDKIDANVEKLDEVVREIQRNLD